MRKTVLSVVLLLFSFGIVAQKIIIDSLEHQAKTLRGRAGVSAMNALSSMLVSDNPTKAELVANSALEAAKKIGDWRGEALALENLGAIHAARLQYLKALIFYQKSLTLSKHAKDDLGQAQSKLKIGILFFRLDDPDQASQVLSAALSQAKIANWNTGVAEINDLLGEIGQYKKSYLDAQLHFKTAFDTWSSLSDAEKAGDSALKIAESALATSDFNTAKHFLDMALQHANRTGNEKKIATINHMLAAVHLANNDLGEASKWNEMALAENLKQANTLAMAENHRIASEIYLAKDNKKESVKSLKRAGLLLEHKESSPALITLLENLSNIAADAGEPALEKQFQNKLLEAKALLAKALLDTNRRTLHELLSNKLEDISLQNRIETLESASVNDKRIRSLMFVLLGLVGFMSALVYIFYKKNITDNEQLLTQHEEIKRQKAEQAELNKEMGMKNISLEMLNKKLVEEIAERENVERSSFARDRFLATISHEMRTPLNAIIGLTHLLMEQDPRHDQIEQFRTLQFSANELVVFINDVLGFSKIEAGKLDLQSREFDLAETALTIFHSFEKKALEKDLHFYSSFDSQIPKRLVGDDSRFYQVLNNLLNNCLESTKQGVLRAEVYLEAQREREIIVKLVLECSDGGHHQALPEREQIWNEAEIYQESLNPRQLSLAITKRLVELQQGKFEIENVFGEATRFVVLMPFKKAIQIQNNIIQLDTANYTQLRGAKVLVAEDNKINQLVVVKILRKHGMSVITADNGYEALEQIELHHFDMVLMDIQMPEMDGYRATAEIRNHPSQEKRNVPIIALTSSAFLTEKEKAVLFGMTDYVGKPFSPDELLEKIAGCLQVHRRY